MEGDLRLENQLCFALYDAARTMAGAYQTALTPLGLTYPQFLVLLVLWEKDGSTVSQLGSRLHLDSGTLSPLLKRLEALGLVERRRESQDGRTVTIRLTERGAGLESQAATLQGDLRDQLAMSDEELAALHVLAARFCSVARSPTAGTPSPAEHA
ncbi:MarR family winged helix-turn-helix transcriptional regulator [Arthrobacter sp. CAN_C5]|uniref:MarR family winged helix-turn-helix transcriptional regulator n=1 Tax=Arthrobacter sp. CAN_C5 TaxID=2760706 RepID=UPI001AE5BF35|nr:MarR family transcriptional regulator [Arthrobacter sp. CAN_C5]MBP2216457.1 DNA-binding MarR family transcriptional regulator [Arthrobacter sp. CAN_C5]